MANYRYPRSADGDPSATLTQRVYDSLRQEILGGELRPGHRLVRRVLSKRLGVSPVSVTEALFRLEMDGLVESKPLYGSRVRPLSLDDVQNDEVLREAIECQAARCCALHASPGSLPRLSARARILDRMMAEGDPHSRLGTETHQEFHLDIARCGGFPRLAEELQRVWFRRLMRLSWVKATQYRRVPGDWHQQLVAAIAAGDPDAAEAKMREHVRYGNEDDREALRFLLDHEGIAEEESP